MGVSGQYHGERRETSEEWVWFKSIATTIDRNLTEFLRQQIRTLIQSAGAEGGVLGLRSLKVSTLSVTTLLTLTFASGSVSAQTTPAYLQINGQDSQQQAFGDDVPNYGVARTEKLPENLVKAANYGNPSAQIQLGLQYLRGDGVPRDDTAAANWFMRSAVDGSSDGQYMVGFMYQTGRGVPEDHQEALRWFQAAASKGQPYAEAALASVYIDGRDKPHNYSVAMKLSRNAAKHHVAMGEFNLGSLYMFGLGVEASVPEGIQWYKKAAEHGNLDAMVQIGITYLLGQGVPVDEKEGKRWLLEGAEAGSAVAQFDLGYFYEHQTPEPDRSAAMKWYQLASDQNYEPA